MAGSMTPMMRQYMEMKEQYKDCFLFYRLGDFYEMFFDDAVTVSKLLELTLTGRDCGLTERAPMCGVPYHSVDQYIDKLIGMGYKVAICEQMEDPALAKGLVERAITRVVTPGTVLSERVLDAGKNNYLAAVCLLKGRLGLAYADVSTGAFYSCELRGADAKTCLIDELARIHPTELIVSETLYADELLKRRLSASYFVEKLGDAAFAPAAARDRLKRHFGVATLEGFGLTEQAGAIGAAGALMQYLEETQKNALTHIHSLQLVDRSRVMQLDASTRRNLELTTPLRFGGSPKNTLLGLLNHTQTGMGARLLRAYIDSPLRDKAAIDERLDAVKELYSDTELCMSLGEQLSFVRDVERSSAKIAYGSISPRELIALASSLRRITALKTLLTPCKCAALKRIETTLDPMEEVSFSIEAAISAEPPVNSKDGGLIREGYNAEVDELRNISVSAKAWLDKILAAERDKTGIKLLRIGYNRVFGYYLEVSKSQVPLVPYYYQRKQTLSTGERYITPELKEVEEKILTAGSRLNALEAQLFSELKQALTSCTQQLQQNADAVAELDVYRSFAEVAMQNRYVCPTITEDGVLSIKNGRHPIVERSCKEGFIPNDALLDTSNNRLLILTGPNMAGKSTYMRQVALIALMAQLGSFVPADEASIGIVDRIFTRIGANDDLASGQSTFMVEMSELANILNNATKNSLLILDEIGRGTSTFDGLSIAWAVLEHIASVDSCGAKTLFATHFHELSELEGRLAGVINYRISVKELGEDILFLRKIVRGSADKSFGIQVARLAGLPKTVVNRAKGILKELEKADVATAKVRGEVVEERSKERAMDLIAASVLGDLGKLDMDELTPKQAYLKLTEYQQALQREG